MTVKDTPTGSMAKRQKTEQSASDTKTQQVSDTHRDVMHRPSDEMLSVIIAATRTPDLNIVDFSDTISDVEIMPEPEPLSDSDLPPRSKKHRKHKKHHKDRKADKQSADIAKSEDKDKPGTSSSGS